VSPWKPLAHVAFALLLAALQAALLRWLGGGAFSLSLLAICVVWAGLHGGNVDGSLAAAGIGYVMDLMAGTPKGLLTFLSVALFLTVRLASAAVDLKGRGALALLSGLGTLFLSVGAMLLLRNTTGTEGAPGGELAGRMIVEALLTAAVAPLVGLGLRWLDARFHREEPGLLG
jgi:rod shape-determining protein MreD